MPDRHAAVTDTDLDSTCIGGTAELVSTTEFIAQVEHLAIPGIQATGADRKAEVCKIQPF